MKKRHAAVLLLLFAVTALCAVLGEGAASRASVLSIDPRDAGSIEAFVGRWLSEEADDLKYTAATIDVGSCGVVATQRPGWSVHLASILQPD